ncbi:MAG: exonuclease SbcCD subunit D [Chloroflexota bacterium]
MANAPSVISMRFLHTSDWHIGKPLRNQKRDSEHVAALEEVLAIARDQRVDALLIAGDVFDSAVPPPEAERIFFHFIGELVGAGIPAVIIAGNHDHPRRMNAYAPVLRHLGVRVVGEPVLAEEGGVIELPSLDGNETAVIATLPWVSERKVRDFESLMTEGKHLEEYADGVAAMLNHLCKSFRPDAINIAMAHVFVAGAKVPQESGERPLHTGLLYTIAPARLPTAPQYIALGHVHMPQDVGLSNAQYCGSLLQCDFGEAGQQKRVNLVDAAPGRKAKVEAVPLKSIRQLRNVGSAKQGVSLDEIRALAADVSDAYLKVFVKVDRPVPGLAEQVRELLPNAVDIVIERPEVAATEDSASWQKMTAPELFDAYYRQETGGNEPRPELAALFRQLHEEVTSAAD